MITREAKKDNISEACILYVTKDNEALKLWWITDDYQELVSKMPPLLFSLLIEINRAQEEWIESSELEDDDDE